MTNKTKVKEFVNQTTRSLVSDVDAAIHILVSERHATETQVCDVDYGMRNEKLNILDERIGELAMIKTKLNRMLKKT